jgi:hypothetical protein
MKISAAGMGVMSAFVTLLFLSPTSRAEIYKWVDSNGQTHYSERKEEAGRADTLKLKIESQPPSTPMATPSPQYWQEQERKLKQSQAQKREERASVSPVMKPKSLSGGREDGTDASRCALARDVLSGAVRHRNGAPTDAYDREVAESDIRMFCH